jgi:uncharacterized iron-regulated membrane protein
MSKIASSRYRAIWRWHFYAGIFIAPVLVILAATGAIYLFDREIDRWWNREIAVVPVGRTVANLAAQEANVRVNQPGATINRVVLPFDPGDTAKWLVTTKTGVQVEVHVDPYRNRVTGTIDPSMQPTVIARTLHGTLFGGEVGSYVVELVACWTLVMLVTGLMLWWPKTWHLLGTLLPRIGGRDRLRWRDFHAIPNALIAVFVAMLILTGLPWSAFWGVQFAKIGSVVPFIAPTPNFASHAPTVQADMPPAHDHGQHVANDAGSKVPWVIQHSQQPNTSGGESRGIADVEPHLVMLDTKAFGGGVRIFYPATSRDPFMVNYVPDRAQGQRTIHVDPANGRMLDDIGWEDYSPGGKAVEWGVMLHTGRQYGLINQLVNLLVCLTLIGSIIAGLTLWLKKRPPGAFASRQTRPDDRLSPGAKVAMATLAVLLPMVAMSLALVLLLDRFLIPRLSDVARWMGLRGDNEHIRNERTLR